jgi:hypothetical protein
MTALPHFPPFRLTMNRGGGIVGATKAPARKRIRNGVAQHMSSSIKIVLATLAALSIFQAPAVGGLDADIPLSNRVILASGAWTPSATETQKALVAIQLFLERPTSGDRRSMGEIRQILGNATHYRVQFMGVVRRKRKVIWCNFFPAPRHGEKDEFEYWKRTVVRVSDGGYWYWQIVYDPATGKCQEFCANGYA